MTAVQIVACWWSRWPGLHYGGWPLFGGGHLVLVSVRPADVALVSLVRRDAGPWEINGGDAHGAIVPNLDAAEALLEAAMDDLNKRTAEVPRD